MVFATYLAPCNRPLYEHVARACGAGDFVVGADWRELAGGEIDVAVVCSPPLIWLEGMVEAVAAPVLADERFGGLPLYASDIIVPAESPARGLEDLRGARWAVNEPSSWSGYWATLARVGAWAYFGEVVEAGYHQEAIRLVAEAKVDGAAIDCQVLAFQLARQPGLAGRLRTVGALGPAPSQPVVVRANLDLALKAAVRRRVLELQGAALRRHGFERFAPAPDYSFVARVVAGRATTRGEPQWLQKP